MNTKSSICYCVHITVVQECTIEGQVYTTCGSACPPTCRYIPYGCIEQCIAGCQCPRGTILDEAANKCVKKKEDCGMNKTSYRLLITQINTMTIMYT